MQEDAAENLQEEKKKMKEAEELDKIKDEKLKEAVSVVTDPKR
jgi:ABC-type multidrug transport system fused ATPase/permease subunit